LTESAKKSSDSDIDQSPTLYMLFDSINTKGIPQK